MAGPTKANLQAELARLRGQVAALQQRAEQAESALGASEAREQALAQELGESLEQQTATSDVLRAISTSPAALEAVYDVILDRIMRLCEADIAALFLYDGELLSAVASRGTTPRYAEHLQRSRPRPSHETTTRLAALERRPVHVADLLNDPEFTPAPRDLYESENVRTVLSVPMLQEDRLVGVLTTWRREVRPFADRQVALLQTFADQAVIAVENARLFRELDARNRDLTEALERQTATSEVLGVISSSPTDVQPVFDAIVRSAGRLCEASFAALGRYEGGIISLAANHNLTAEELDVSRRAWPIPATRATLGGRAIVERRIVHVEDVHNDPDHRVPGVTMPASFRSGLAVPLLRGGDPIGVLVMWRREVRPFSDSHIELVKTFADQAVIAIENVRLFKELEARNADLTEALEQQTATAEILRVISSSPTDVQPVLDAVAEAAARLCGATDTVIRRVDGEALPLWAHYGSIPLAALAETLPLTPARAIGRAILERRPIHVHDVADRSAREEYPDTQTIAQYA